MKTKILFTVIAVLAAWNGFAQDKLFDKLSNQKNITQVTVSKGLLNLMPDMASSMDMNGVDVKDIVNKLEQIDIFTSQDNEAKKMMRKEATDHFANNKSYEVLMKIKEEKSNVIFYAQKDGNFIKSLVMFSDGELECVLIRLLGKFTTEDVKKVVNAK
ncbi:hypothetical protein FACS189432_00020 [Bacteroidia bacterium]|nr:hypothetical protein FACS189426_01560 [Bacteroidia bacterium]GHT26169.1 hypothetical protein FACS189432_00020 [Bacteroidia bacterium]GHT85731.1 hypothetical protein FACS18947_4840 [Bacteroidia bacterium]